MQIIRVQNPRALLDPNLQAFILETVKGGPLDGMEPDTLFKTLIDRAVVGSGALHTAVQAGEFRGLAITFPPEGPLETLPQVVTFYAKRGSKKGLKSGLLLALVDFLKENHYTKAQVITAAGVRDSVFRRAFKKAGKSKKVGSIMELDLTVG